LDSNPTSTSTSTSTSSTWIRFKIWFSRCWSSCCCCCCCCCHRRRSRDTSATSSWVACDFIITYILKYWITELLKYFV
jgi:hypothetical protein